MKKIRVSRRILAALVAGVLSTGGFLAGCSDDNGDGGVVGPGSSAIAVTDIIFNPKSLGPGDTLVVTVVVTSDSPNVGDFVTYEWTATGGEWIDTDRSNQATVRWRAPADRTGIFGFTVTAKNSVSSSTRSSQVFVGRLEEFISQRAGQIYAVPSSGGIYYTSPPGVAENGLALRYKDGAADDVVYDIGHAGRHYSFDNERRHEAHTFVERQLYVRTTVVHDDLVAKTQTPIGRDNRDFAVRWSEFTRPGVSPDGRWISFQGGLLDQTATPAQGGVDTFAVFVYDVMNQTTKRATFKGYANRDSVSNSFYPSISSDSKHVVFVSDRGGAGIWEYYALPILSDGVAADTIPDALVKLTTTGGAVTSGNPIPAAVAASQWNPNAASPILASIGADKRLRLIDTGTGGRLVDVEGDVTDVRWAPNGQFLVASVVAGGQNRIYRIPVLGGDYRVLWTARAGDRIGELSVSPDGEVLVYANRRGQNVWYELVPADRIEGDAPAVRITGAWVPSAAATYGAPLQSLRPVWASMGKVAYLFFTDGATPSVMSLDLSGLGD